MSLYFEPIDQQSELGAELNEYCNLVKNLTQQWRLFMVEEAISLHLLRRGFGHRTTRIRSYVPKHSTVRRWIKHQFRQIEEEIAHPLGLRFIRLTRLAYLLVSDRQILGVVSHQTSGSIIDWNLTAIPEVVDILKGQLKELLTRDVPPVVRRLVIENEEVRSTTVAATPPSIPKDYRALYPYFSQTPGELWDDFAASKSNVLLLIGEPGTGKSSFIMEMLRHRGWGEDIHLADRHDVLGHSGFVGYIRKLDRQSVLVTEDSDLFVQSRESGNSQMSGLLNTISGIISTEVKLIISTNLKSLSQVDPALLRPGRTFKILHFQRLTLEEAQAARRTLNLPAVEFPTTEDTLTLAEALNYHECDVPTHRKPGVGFI